MPNLAGPEETEEGAELSRKAIAMADAAMMVLSIYQVGLALGGAAGRRGRCFDPGALGVDPRAGEAGLDA